MVSFQCSGCGDIVKKPKLDTHYTRCHASVDCIDCSTTFRIPSEFKGHTSCITEAEKYQKGLYKGPKAKQDQKQKRVKDKANGDMKINEQARDQPKEQPEKGDGAAGGKSTPATPEPSKLSNPSEETTATTPSTGKAKDKKRKEKKSKSKDIADKHTPKTAPSAIDPAPLPTPVSAEKVVEPTGQKLQEDGEGERIEESENAATKDEDSRTDHKVEDEGGEKTEAKKSKRKKKHKQKIPDSATAVVESNGAQEDAAMEVNELKVAIPQEKNEESKKDKHVEKKKRKDRSSTSTMKEVEGGSGKEQPKSAEKNDRKTAASEGDGEDTSKAKDDSKKRKRGDVEGNGGVNEGNDKKAKKAKGGKKRRKEGSVQQYWAFRDYISPVLKESKFKEHGRITPEEFVAAGDFLTYKFPVWQWEKGDASKARDYLPADKQYLVTRGVACLRRAQSLAYTDADEDAERLLSFGDSSSGLADEWVETHAGRKGTVDSAANPGEIDDIPDLDGDHDQLTTAMGNVSLTSSAGATVAETPDLDDIPDMEEEDLEAEDDEATAAPPPRTGVLSSGGVIDASQVEAAKGNLLQVRTYDVMITYDKYYQTPRIWLIGYDENRNPLTPAQIFQDVSADHALKTVTIEAFPHSTSLQAASVHPCKHASVMKKVIERMNAGVEEQFAARKKDGSSKDSNSKKKWAFGRKSSKDDSKDKSPATEEDEQPEAMRVDFYLVVFLKFIASIVPTIEVDSTTSF